jgi:hypothetical protein
MKAFVVERYRRLVAFTDVPEPPVGIVAQEPA